MQIFQWFTCSHNHIPFSGKNIFVTKHILDQIKVNVFDQTIDLFSKENLEMTNRIFDESSLVNLNFLFE